MSDEVLEHIYRTEDMGNGMTREEESRSAVQFMGSVLIWLLIVGLGMLAVILM